MLDNGGLSNLVLKSNDVIRIYSKVEVEGDTRYVKIKGNVKKPGTYELFESNMTIYDILFRAGGIEDSLFKASTFMDRADLIRFDSQIDKKIISFNLGNVINDKTDLENYVLQSGDEIVVYSKAIFERPFFVEINGLVSSPNKYLFKINMTLKDLILEAGGITETILKPKVEVSRIVEKENSSSSTIQIYEVGLDKDYSTKFVIVDGEKINNEDTFFLKPNDFVSIREDKSINYQAKVGISGMVKYPGIYLIRNDKEKLSEIIERSGGLIKNAYPFGSTFVRNGQEVKVDFMKIIKKPKSKSNIVVIDGDQIKIAEHFHMISVVGEVNSPGVFSLQKGIRVRKAIANAGGFNRFAEKDNVHIKYPNGISKKYHPILSNPLVYDNSVIVVGKKEEEEPFDKTEYAKELSSIIADFAQTISLFMIAR